MEDVSKKVQEILWKCTFCAERSYRTVKKYDVIGAVRSRDQYDYRSSMIAGPVWSQEHPDKGRIWDKDQYDHTAGINGQYDYRTGIKGPVWSYGRYHQGLVWSQEHPDKGRIWDKDQYDHTAGINGQYDYRTGIKGPVWSPQDRCHPGTSIITGPVWSCGRYHQGTSIIEGPVWSQDQYDRMAIIKGAVWSQDRYHPGTSMVTAPVWLQDRDDHSASVFTTSVWSQDPEELVVKNQLLYLFKISVCHPEVFWHI